MAKGWGHRTLLVWVVAGLAAGALTAARPVRTVPAYDTGNLLRLHIVAASDAPGDQAVKLRVRDAVLARFGELWARASSPADLEALIRRDWDRLQAVAQEAVRQSGARDPVRLELGEFDFPARTYAGWTLPAGRYRSLRIVIGEGAGRNWWCILFPPLCVDGRPAEEGTGRRAGDAAPGVRQQGAPGGRNGPAVRVRWLEGLERLQVARRLRALWESSAGWMWPRAAASAPQASGRDRTSAPASRPPVP